jgi:hypothetical protein
MEQQALKPQSRIIEAEATAVKPQKPASNMDSALVLFLSTGFCGVVLGLFLYFLHHF